MTVRNAVTRSGRGIRGYYPSTKMGLMIPWESLLERDAILIFEFSPGVQSYRAQPELILYPHGDRVCRYFPDFEISTAGGINVQIEVKTSAHLAKPKNAEKYRAIAAYYQSVGRNFRILTELETRREPLHSNLKILMRHHRHNGELTGALSDVAKLLQKEARPLQDLGLETEIVWRLLAHGDLHCDLTQPVTASTLISLPQGDCDDSLLF